MRTLFRSRAILVIFHMLAQIMYDANIREQEAWQPGQYSLATLNYGSLTREVKLEKSCSLAVACMLHSYWLI